MKLNKNRTNEWESVKDAMYKIWIGSQTGPILPRWCDFEFKKQVARMMKNYSLHDCKQFLNIA